MSLFKKTLLECLAVAAVGGIICVVVLVFEKVEWQKFTFTDTTLIVCCLLALTSIPVLCYGFVHKAANISDEAQEAIRWLLFGMMSLLFLGILACVFKNPGAVVVVILLVTLSIFITKVLTGKTYNRGEHKWYKLKNWEVAGLSLFAIGLSLACVLFFTNQEIVKNGGLSWVSLLFLSFVSMERHFNGEKRVKNVRNSEE